MIAVMVDMRKPDLPFTVPGISTFSLPWPPIAAHLDNLAMDMGAPLSSLVGAGWRLEGVHSQPGPARARARIAGTCAVLCLARERDVPFASGTMKGGLGSGHEGVPFSSLVTAGWRLESVHSQPGSG